jgi:hypothetical protein
MQTATNAEGASITYSYSNYDALGGWARARRRRMPGVFVLFANLDASRADQFHHLSFGSHNYNQF